MFYNLPLRILKIALSRALKSHFSLKIPDLTFKESVMEQLEHVLLPIFITVS